MSNLDDLAARERASGAPASASRSGIDGVSNTAWMILRNDTQLGPYTLDDLRRFVALGEVDSETKAWR